MRYLDSTLAKRAFEILSGRGKNLSSKQKKAKELSWKLASWCVPSLFCEETLMIQTSKVQ